MSQKIIDYALDNLTPANPDSSCPATVTGCTVVSGPGSIPAGTYPKALDFSGGGQLKTTLPLPKLNRVKFCVRTIFRIDTAVTARQALLESNALPFGLYLTPGSGSTEFNLVAAVTTNAYGVGNAATEFFLDLHLGTWYTADLVYDTDTLAVFSTASFTQYTHSRTAP